jgi:hypothetical protein
MVRTQTVRGEKVRSETVRGGMVAVVRRLLVVGAGVGRTQLVVEVVRALRMEAEEDRIPEAVVEVVQSMQAVAGPQTLPCPRRRM